MITTHTFRALLEGHGFETATSEGRIFATLANPSRPIELLAAPHFTEWSVYARSNAWSVCTALRSTEEVQRMIDLCVPSSVPCEVS